jgi:hypothetical protein
MSRSTRLWSGLAVCSALLGCGSDSNGDSPKADASKAGAQSVAMAGSGDTGAAGKASPGTAANHMTGGYPDHPEWTNGTADPCDIHTGYPGDELCILPPDPAVGFQLHYGPKNYDDPAEVAKYLLMPGQEVTDCVFMTTPNETDIFHNEYHGRMRPGSHHLLVYTQMMPHAATDGPADCNQGTDSRNILGAQTPKIDIVPSPDGAPENIGLAQSLPAKQQAMFQMHFINMGDKPILREGWANVVYVDKSQVKQQADPIFFLAGISSSAAPKATTINKGKAVAMMDLRLVQATGHYHAHTVRFSAWKTIAGVREPLFEDYNWHEPTMLSFDSKTQNSAPDPDAKVAGGYSGDVNLKTGDMIDWECEIVNDTDKPLRFGNEVYGAEMCNMFGIYTPGTGKPWSATNL